MHNRIVSPQWCLKFMYLLNKGHFELISAWQETFWANICLTRNIFSSYLINKGYFSAHICLTRDMCALVAVVPASTISSSHSSLLQALLTLRLWLRTLIWCFLCHLYNMTQAKERKTPTSTNLSNRRHIIEVSHHTQSIRGCCIKSDFQDQTERERLVV